MERRRMRTSQKVNRRPPRKKPRKLRDIVAGVVGEPVVPVLPPEPEPVVADEVDLIPELPSEPEPEPVVEKKTKRTKKGKAK